MPDGFAAAVSRCGEPVGFIVIDQQKYAAERPCNGVNPVHHGNALVDGGGNRNNGNTLNSERVGVENCVKTIEQYLIIKGFIKADMIKPVGELI